mmetsp:Transcript_16090/g.52341  ORF Transcript_16090/g.52341 Transcript_16090/m.52341 type:complete len:330 (-) Transcript_16090:574-1563(-)
MPRRCSPSQTCAVGNMQGACEKEICNYPVGGSRNISWIKTDIQQLNKRSICSRSATLELRGGTPTQVCVRDDGLLAVIVIATLGGHVDVFVSCSAASSPTPHPVSRQGALGLLHVESLFITDLAHKQNLRLQLMREELYFIHETGIAIINLPWVPFLKDLVGAKLESLISRHPSTCQHVIFSSDSLRTVVGAGLLQNSAVGSSSLLCWFNDGSCCAMDLSSSRYAPTELRAAIQQSSAQNLQQLTEELFRIFSHARMIMGRLPAQVLGKQKSLDSLQNELTLITLTLETNTVLKVHHCTNISTALAQALELVSGTQKHQLDFVSHLLKV